MNPKSSIPAQFNTEHIINLLWKRSEMHQSALLDKDGEYLCPKTPQLARHAMGPLVLLSPVWHRAPGGHHQDRASCGLRSPGHWDTTLLIPGTTWQEISLA